MKCRLLSLYGSRRHGRTGQVRSQQHGGPINQHRTGRHVRPAHGGEFSHIESCSACVRRRIRADDLGNLAVGQTGETGNQVEYSTSQITAKAMAWSLFHDVPPLRSPGVAGLSPRSPSLRAAAARLLVAGRGPDSSRQRAWWRTGTSPLPGTEPSRTGTRRKPEKSRQWKPLFDGKTLDRLESHRFRGPGCGRQSKTAASCWAWEVP